MCCYRGWVKVVTLIKRYCVFAGLLPPGFKLNATESPEPKEVTKAAPQLPTRPTRKPPPSKTKSGGGLAPPPPKIQKGWPTRLVNLAIERSLSMTSPHGY